MYRVAGMISTARVQRGESLTARCASTEDISLHLILSREHRANMGVLPFFIFSTSLQGEWARLPFPARIERAHSYRARSASKKGTWPLPSPTSFSASAKIGSLR
jgi:hypothetical protein